MSAPEQSPSTGRDRFFTELRTSPVRRVRQGKVVAGTAAGVARYFGVDPIVVRVAFVIITILTGIGITSYLIAWLLLPDDDGTLLIERAMRDHDGRAITLAVFAGLSLLSTGDEKGWAQSLLTALVIAAAGWFLWRRHSRRMASNPPAHPVSSPPPGPFPGGGLGPGAAEHGSPTRGGFSRFDPVTGRWVPATPDPAPPEGRGASSIAAESGAGGPTDYVPTHPYPMTGRAATWSAPGASGVSDVAGAAETSDPTGQPVRARRPRLAWWISTLVLLLAAAVGVGSGALAYTLPTHAQPYLVGGASALVIVAIALLVTGIRGFTSRLLVIAALLLLPVATGVVGFEVAAPPNAYFHLIFGAS